MTDLELLQQFSRTIPVPNGTALEVCTIHWQGPHTPQLEWQIAEILPEESREAAIAASQQELLNNPDFFGICEECHTRNPVGWMHRKNLCQCCASTKYGIVY